MNDSLLKQACSEHDRHNEKYQEDEEEHFCNGRCTFCYSTETKECSDNSNDEKDN